MPVLRTCDAASNNWDGATRLSPLTSSSKDSSIRKSSRPSKPSSRLSDAFTGSYVLARRIRNKSTKVDKVYAADEEITICGITLIPTVAFDTFWRFAAERKLIDDRRRAGVQWPWTDDPILQKYHFCNTFRVLDRLSQYIIREVIEKGSQEPQELAFRIILFNLFTKIETWEMLQEAAGTLKWATYNRTKYAAVLHKAKRQGKAIYTGAFQKPAPKFDQAEEGYVNHLILLEIFMGNEIHERLMHAQHVADIFEFLISFPSMGEFAAYQLVLNFSYSKLLNFHRDDFVVPGPGASSGLGKMFGESIAAKSTVFEIEVIRWLTENQKYCFERLGLIAPELGPKSLPMDVADVEHTLCELDKYARLAHSHLKGRRKEIRRSFEPKSRLPAVAVLPKAWAHPTRKTPRIRPDKSIAIEKRYLVDRIKAHCDDEDTGVRWYLVFWWGYPDEDATWESEPKLIDDAPLAVQEYWDNLNKG